MSTHNISEVSALCHRVYVMFAGRVRFTGTPAELAGLAADRVWRTMSRTRGRSAAGSPRPAPTVTSATCPRVRRSSTRLSTTATCCSPDASTSHDRVARPDRPGDSVAADGCGGRLPGGRVGARRAHRTLARSASSASRRRRWRRRSWLGLRDRAANLLAAVPTSAEVRRACRLMLLVPVAIAVWLAYLWPAQALVPWLGWPVGPVAALISTGVALAALIPRAGLAVGVVVPLPGRPPPGRLAASTRTSRCCCSPGTTTPGS